MTSSHWCHPHFVRWSRKQPQEPNRWTSASVCARVRVHWCVRVCVCIGVSDARNEDQSSGRIAYCYSSCPLLTCTQLFSIYFSLFVSLYLSLFLSHTHAHTPAFIKTSHSVDIVCAVRLSAVNGIGCVFTVDCKSCRVLSCQSLMNC